MESDVVSTLNLGSEFSDYNSVDGHQTCFDVFVGIAARANTRIRHELVEAQRLCRVIHLLFIAQNLLLRIFGLDGLFGFHLRFGLLLARSTRSALVVVVISTFCRARITFLVAGIYSIESLCRWLGGMGLISVAMVTTFFALIVAFAG